jgi:putative membrane protein
MRLYRSILLASLMLFYTARPLAAHAGAPLAPHDLWSAWNLDPAIVLGLATTAWLYNRGLAALWRRAGRGRGARYSQVIAFYGGLLALAAALVSPLDGLSSVLFSAHMVQHLLLMVVAAPLLVWGAPAYVLVWAAPRRRRRLLARWWRRQAILPAAWQIVSAPLAAWLLHAAVLWGWHAPRLYQAALDDAFIHLLEHASFFGMALLFWWVVLDPYGRGLRFATGMLMAFTTALHSGLLGMLLTFAATPWYPGYWLTTAQWGLTPLEDQQLAGVIMWAPAGGVYLATTLTLLAVWLAASEREASNVKRETSSVNLGAIHDV